MGCINGVVNLKAALRSPSNEDLFMFFGADVSSDARTASMSLLIVAIHSGDAHDVFG